MRLILSRKGFDSSWGGHACPILPDGTLLVLPIPVPSDGPFAGADKLGYFDLRVPGRRDVSYAQVMRSHGMEKLTVGKVRRPLDEGIRCHLDPDLLRDIADREGPWKAAFGQSDAAEGHLRRQGVDVGDVFLFFGLFRRSDGSRFVEATRRHVLFGYLQIGKIYRTDEAHYRPPAWAHPHFEHPCVWRGQQLRFNGVYAASDELTIDGRRLGVPGQGMFQYDDSFVLTRPNARSHTEWCLPELFRSRQISYHGCGGRYGWREPEGYFQSAHRGQEFVIDIDASPDAVRWLEGLVSRRASL